MRVEGPSSGRKLTRRKLSADLCVVGGGMAGVCCAITAVRQGLNVVLVTDRPVLGGNASSEVRLWVLGATAHLTNNNRWSREGGVLDELLVENLYRNPEGNALIFDTILLEKVIESGVTLLLNTCVDQVTKQGDRIASVRGFCSQTSVEYEISAPLFCDASGDGIVGMLSGAAFRMGAEAQAEFGEKFAPTKEYGELLGHSMYFYSKDAGRPAKFVAPSFALKDITQIPRYSRFDSKTDGCRLWWIEYGGRLNTVEDTEKIKWELWKVVYGVWDYIKNSGKFPDAENLTLEWVSHIPGKRESRRFEGDYILKQQDIVEQKHHDDVVSHGGWSIDLHPADGVYSALPGCNQWHARGVYEIPYRCLYSRNIRNLFLAGRIISSSHVAFGTTRVMATCAVSAQAVGMAAAICKRDRALPADLSSGKRLAELQKRLVRSGQFVPWVDVKDPEDLAASAEVSASSSLSLAALPPDGDVAPIRSGIAQMLPLAAGPCPAVRVFVSSEAECEIQAELRATVRKGNFSPDVILEAAKLKVPAGKDRTLDIRFSAVLQTPGYCWLVLKPIGGSKPSVRMSRKPVTGLLAVRYGHLQAPEADIGVESFEVWRPDRGEMRQNLAFELSRALKAFEPGNVTSGVSRPWVMPNAWVANPSDSSPSLSLRWPSKVRVKQVILEFDADYDHPMESVLLGHPESVIPMCVKSFRITSDGRTLFTEDDNHQTRAVVTLRDAVETSELGIDLLETHGGVPPSLFGVRVFASEVEIRKDIARV